MARALGSGACIFFLLFGGLLPLISNAQAIGDPFPGVADDAPVDLGGGGMAPEGASSCFDYYSFGSVQAKLTGPANAVSGTSVTFTGVLENANAYPIVDGSLYVKVFRDRVGANDGNGPDVVDQFYVKSDLVIPAKGSMPISFQWMVPAYAQSGEYRLATFFTTSRKFNLLGLSFTDDVVGNTVPFTVAGERTTGVGFDKASARVDGKAHRFAATPVRVSATGSVPVAVTVRNTTGESQTAKVSWTIYQQDAQLRENVVQEESVSVTVPARGSAPVTVTVSDTTYPVYYAVATLEWEDTTSVVGIRFVREGIDRPRINFPGISTFPLRAGEEAVLFACLHNSSDGLFVPDGRLELTLSDLEGTIFREHVYTGNITSQMMGVADRFIPETNRDAFVLDARLYSGGAFVDEARIVYDCARIDPTQCNSTDAEGKDSLAQFLMNDPRAFLALGAGVGLLVLLVIMFFVLRMLRYRASPPPPPSTPSSMTPPTI